MTNDVLIVMHFQPVGPLLASRKMRVSVQNELAAHARGKTLRECEINVVWSTCQEGNSAVTQARLSDRLFSKLDRFEGLHPAMPPAIGDKGFAIELRELSHDVIRQGFFICLQLRDDNIDRPAIYSRVFLRNDLAQSKHEGLFRRQLFFARDFL